MPYAQPSDQALSAAFEKIAESADASPAGAIDAADALKRADQVLWWGTRRLSARLQDNVTGAWGDELFVLRDFVVDYAAQVVAALRTAVVSGALLGVPVPTRDRLAALAVDYGPRDDVSTHVEELGEDDDQTLIEQFAVPLMLRGTDVPGSSRSEVELVRASFGVIGAAAILIAAIEKRPPLHREWDD